MGFLIQSIIYAVLGLMTVSCGGQAKDNRILLDSQSEGHLVIPEGIYKGSVISRERLGEAIAKQINSISEVYAISMREALTLSEAVFNVTTLGIATFSDHDNEFFVSFTAKTPTGEIFSGIECIATSDERRILRMRNCQNKDVIFRNIIVITNRDDIIVNNS